MRGRLGTCLALTAVVAVTGCGSDHPRKPARVISDAVAKTTEAGSMRLSQKLSATVFGDPLGEGWIKAVVDMRRRRASMSYDLGFLAKAAKDVPAGFLRGKAVFPDDELAYFRLEALEGVLDPPKRWFKVTRQELEDDPGLGGGMSGMGTLDPVLPIDHFRAVTGDAEVLGDEVIDGSTTTHYRAELDFRNYPPLAPPSYRRGLERTVDKLDEKFGRTAFPFEFWIARDGTIRRVRGEMRGRGGRLEFTMDLFEIGEPVHIRVPPPRTVADADDL